MTLWLVLSVILALAIVGLVPMLLGRFIGGDADKPGPRPGRRPFLLGMVMGWFSLAVVLALGYAGRFFMQAPHDTVISPDVAFGLALASAPAPQLEDVNTMMTRLSARLAHNPDDLEGWKMLGWSHMRMGDPIQAADAYAQASALAPDDATLHAWQGVALIEAGSGAITPQALAAIDRALAIDPTQPDAGYYKGLALHQAGQTAQARLLWQKVLPYAPPDTPWLPDLRQHLATPSAAPASDQTRALLMERVQAHPNNIDDWVQLIRAHGAAGDEAAVAAGLEAARGIFAGRSELARIEALAVELYLKLE